MPPRGSILGPLLFNIFLNDIFMFISKCNLCHYADDNTLYSLAKYLNRIRRNLEMEFMILHQWLHENHMTLNPGKCYYMVIGSRDLSHEIMLSNNKNTSSNEKKQLGIFLDSHIGSLCRKAGQKISALARSKNYLTSDQRNLLLTTVIKSQFTYCPLIWMFTSRYLNNALNMNIFFSRQNIYNLRNFQELSTSTKNNLNFGTETISYRVPQLWNLIPNNIKSEPTLELFKKKTRKWKCEPCQCRMCKTHLQHTGFIS